MQAIGTIREFRTPQFTVIVDALEDYDCDLSWDETGEVLKKLESGEYLSFCARARVIHSELGEIASDYLGGCIYESLEAFQAPKSYFQDMVGLVCKEARKHIEYLKITVPSIRVRT